MSPTSWSFIAVPLFLAATLAFLVLLARAIRVNSAPDEALLSLLDRDELLVAGVLTSGGFILMSAVSRMELNPLNQILVVVVVASAVGHLTQNLNSAAVRWLLRASAAVLPLAIGFAALS